MLNQAWFVSTSNDPLHAITKVTVSSVRRLLLFELAQSEPGALLAPVHAHLITNARILQKTRLYKLQSLPESYFVRFHCENHHEGHLFHCLFVSWHVIHPINFTACS